MMVSCANSFAYCSVAGRISISVDMLRERLLLTGFEWTKRSYCRRRCFVSDVACQHELCLTNPTIVSSCARQGRCAEIAGRKAITFYLTLVQMDVEFSKNATAQELSEALLQLKT